MGQWYCAGSSDVCVGFITEMANDVCIIYVDADIIYKQIAVWQLWHRLPVWHIG